MTPQMQTSCTTPLPKQVPDSEQNVFHPNPFDYQVSDRDGGMCRVTGVASVSHWARREEEVHEKNVGYGCFMKCEVAHGR
jgi:hypothetical protein